MFNYCATIARYNQLFVGTIALPFANYCVAFVSYRVSSGDPLFSDPYTPPIINHSDLDIGGGP